MTDLVLDLMDYADFSNPIDIAESILQNIRKQSPSTQIQFPLPIHDVAKSLGIVSIKSLYDSDFEGILIKKDHEGFVFYNGKSHVTRQRFTIAHELGHWMIPWHTMGGKTSFECDSKNTIDTLQTVNKQTAIPRIEIEANRFAANLLMPKYEFKLATKNEPCLIKLRQLAFDYQVSFQACCLRFRELSDYDCAIIQHKDFLITNIYLTRNFPKLAISFQVGGPISPRSISATAQQNTELMPVSAKSWLYEDYPKYAELFEQVLVQENGYRSTLLYLDTSNCLDEDESGIEDLTVWKPTFRK